MTKAEKRCEWLTDKYILCLLALFPLFTGFHGYANLTAAKFWLYTGATAAWLLGLLPCLCTGARLFAKKPGAFFYLTCAFLVWNLVSAALSPWREKTFLGAGRYDGLFTQFLYALTALGIARWGRKKIIYVRVFGASIFLCCAVALWQIAGGNPLGLYPNGWRFADAGTLYSGMYLGTVGNTRSSAPCFLSRCRCSYIRRSKSAGTIFFCCSPRQWRSMSCTGASARPRGSRCLAHAR